MNTIGLGLNSPDQWDLSVRVPIPSPVMDLDRFRRSQPQAEMARELKDNTVKDLYVPLASRNVRALMGDNAESLLLYDNGVKQNKCPFKRWWSRGNKTAPVGNCSIRHRPY